MNNFLKQLETTGQTLVREKTKCLQTNVGYRCNLHCSHCHVEAGPERTEVMSWPVMEDVIAFAEKSGVTEIDITGGAPEINPHIIKLLQKMRQIKTVKRILLRTNLAILDEPYCESFPELFAELKVELVASMPCYMAENVDAQRGEGVHLRNIKILQKLNGLGYGMKNSNLELDLVYNPLDNYLPGPQAELEKDYKTHLLSTFGISFNTLYTITNMPIGRFRTYLEKEGLLDGYMKLLVDNFNPLNLSKVMCRSTISINWLGQIYDCDFNQALKLGSAVGATYIGDIEPESLIGLPIATDDHCFACVAGAGSSCQGSL